jgi:hypothetical protein
MSGIWIKRRKWPVGAESITNVSHADASSRISTSEMI